LNQSEPGKVVAFYSFKGGTGRTMALANIGCALARDPKLGRPILLVDWDLEAPGLHRYFRKNVVDAFRGDEKLFNQAPGLIDLFIELQGRLRSDGNFAKTNQDFETAKSLLNEFPLADYIIKTDIPRLYLLKAGCDEGYASKIASFEWRALYDQSPYLLRAFAERLSRDYGFVLIDSRTGLTDTSGICAMLMPEVLVTVFTPNRQNLFGVIGLVRDAARYRANSDDLRPLLVYPLPSRIEALEPELRHTWRVGDTAVGVPGFEELFENTFKEIYELPVCDLRSYFDDVQIQHVPKYAYGEEIAVQVEETSDRFSLTQSYLRFAARLKKGDAPWGSSLPTEAVTDDQFLPARQAPLASGWRWFLSFDSKVEALAETLIAAIRRRDPSSQVFLARGSRRVGYWTPELAREIAESNAFILLVGEQGLGSRQEVEYYEALDRRVREQDFPIILILREGQPAPGLPFLRLLHWIVTPDPSSEKTVAQLMDAAIGGGVRPNELWRYTAPYRGLEPMTEADADFFFGRDREIADVIRTLAGAPDKLLLLVGNSGVGKSSLAQAGVIASLMQQSWPETVGAIGPWPQTLSESRRWCFLKLKPGMEPIRALVETFFRHWQVDELANVRDIDPRRGERIYEWVTNLTERRSTLHDLVDATEHVLKEKTRTTPPAFLIYIDQGEELYWRAERHQRHRFSELIAEGLSDPRLRVMISLRSDFLGYLQADTPLFKTRQQIDVPPLGEKELREVVSRPAQLLRARFETERLIDIITQHTAEDSIKDVGALPLLSYTLEDMWSQMIRRGDGVLRLATQSFELGSVLVDRANTFLATHPTEEAALRRVLLRLATVREDGEPTRRRASRAEFSDDEWRLVSELSDFPNRILVTVTTDSGNTHAEVAHEAIFRRWDKLREWVAAEREFLAWRSGLEAARRAWQATPEAYKQQALLVGAALVQAKSWFDKRAGDLSPPDRDFLVLSVRHEGKVRARAQGVRALVYTLSLSVIVGLIAWINQSYIANEWRWLTVTRPYAAAQIWPYVLSASRGQTLKPGDSFRECAQDCPEMVVVPAGSFTMGSPAGDSISVEEPPQKVVITRPFAVSKFELTFRDWDACVAAGGCTQYKPNDQGWGRGQQPVINVSWDDAQQYVAWLSLMTGKDYRLLSEAEYEYVTRAGTTTVYPWGNELGRSNANCNGCGSKWDNTQTAPVGSFAPNRFGLFGIVGNVFEWVQDCWHDDYKGAPLDGSAWVSGGKCSGRVVRGGSWSSAPKDVRSAARDWHSATGRSADLGFRVARRIE
jgi:formylglycine-generating enzyme required for sulfatase activity/cellulose biosynthesis protein BcsQ